MNLLFPTPMAIEPAFGAALAEGLESEIAKQGGLHQIEALATRHSEHMQNRRQVQVRGDVAIISATGVITRHDDWLSWLLGGRSTASLALDFGAAMADAKIKRIVLEVDSPGGDATGIHELANHIRAINERKPVTAYIGGMGASAAYWLASAAGRVLVDESAMVGSIGVSMAFRNTDARDEKAGVRSITVVSSQSPKKNLPASTDEGQAEWQTVVDAIAAVFVEDVARFRRTSAAHVTKNYGGGGIVVGKEAVRRGMADGLGSLEGIIANAAPRSAGVFRAGQGAATLPRQSGAWDAVVARFGGA